MCPKIRCDILRKKIWKVNQAKLIDVEAVKLRVWRKQVLKYDVFPWADSWKSTWN